MIVIDASAMVDALVGTDADGAVLDAVGGPLSAPHLLDAEVLNVLRGLERGGVLDASTAATAVTDLAALSIARWPIAPLAERIWSLRHTVSAYDASYAALAEGLDVPLWTADRRLARAVGHLVDVRVTGSSA
ncbi:type II toxin-antitoxin system VapC family toxin [Brachybacterium huguangmaarense]